MKRILSSIVLSAIAATSAMAGGEKQVEGLKYYLPKTAVRMQVLVEKTSTEPGQLADYSELYFKKPGAMAAQTSYRIVGVSFQAEGRPDTDKQFTVAVDKKHSVLSVDCDANGTLRAINTKAPMSTKPKQYRQDKKQAPLNPRDYMSQDILTAANLPKMAQLVAQEIYDIRDSRNQLSRGEADNMPKDGEQLRLMYKHLDLQERALMQLFTGTTTVDTTETVMTFVPERADKHKLLFRFSKRFGLTTADDFSGEPYYVDIEDEGVFAKIPEEASMADKQKDDFVLGVNLPGKIRLNVVDAKGSSIGSFETEAAQFGKVELLNGALFGRKFTSHIVLDPTTGSIVELKTEPLE